MDCPSPDSWLGMESGVAPSPRGTGVKPGGVPADLAQRGDMGEGHVGAKQETTEGWGVVGRAGGLPRGCSRGSSGVE